MASMKWSRRICVGSTMHHLPGTLSIENLSATAQSLSSASKATKPLLSLTTSSFLATTALSEDTGTSSSWSGAHPLAGGTSAVAAPPPAVETAEGFAAALVPSSGGEEKRRKVSG